jgi:NHL repeat
VAVDGIITTVAGNGRAGFGGDKGPATDAELDLPLGVAVDSAGRLFIADSDGNRIRRVG